MAAAMKYPAPEDFMLTKHPEDGTEEVSNVVTCASEEDIALFKEAMKASHRNPEYKIGDVDITNIKAEHVIELI